MHRYGQTEITTRWDGKRVYKTTTYPTINPSSMDIIIISNEGDFLDSLAYKYYGDPTLWVLIATANPGLGRGRMAIPAGLTLRIPIDINGIINEFNRLNKTTS